MTDTQREESETGKFSLWVHVKNWVSDYLKTTDLNIDGSKNAGVNVQNLPADYPDATVSTKLSTLLTELQQKLETNDLNQDANDNIGVNIMHIIEEIPTSTSKNNPSYSLLYNGDGRLQYIDQTIGLDQWRKTITYSSGRINNISRWVAV